MNKIIDEDSTYRTLLYNERLPNKDIIRFMSLVKEGEVGTAIDFMNQKHPHVRINIDRVE